MGCTNFVCSKDSYNYIEQQKLLLGILPQFSNLARCYTNDFVIKSHKNLLLNPEAFLLKYTKKIQQKQVIPYIIIQKWKLILYGTNIHNENYIDSLGFDKQVQEDRFTSKTYRFSTQNPFEIRLQDLYFHQSYRQIQKDAGRSYLVPQIKQDLFQKVLKKIANHFPESGYSLGINYIIGYLLLVGMSEIDSFWMFVHLVLNQKFLALGFFQNQLPLAKIIIQIFKNLLKRKNKELYEHLYNYLQVNDESWILKWVISFYLSTFPIQFCHYIWDYILMYGILGLATVGYSIVNQFQNIIFKCDDQADFNLTLKQTLNSQSFSDQGKMSDFMKSVYTVKLKYEDFGDIYKLGDNFYVQYFELYSEWRFKGNLNSRQKIDYLLSQWYKGINEKRQQFTTLAKSFGHKFKISERQHEQIQEENEENRSFDSEDQKSLNKQIKCTQIHKQKEQKRQDSFHEQKEKQKIQIESNLEKTNQFKASQKQQNQKHYENKQVLQMLQIKNISVSVANLSPKTIQVLSNRKKNCKIQSESFTDEKQQSALDHFSFIENLNSKKRLSEHLVQQHGHNQLYRRKVKSEFKINSFKSKNSFSKQKSQFGSSKSQKMENNLMKRYILFDQCKLNKFSFQLRLSRMISKNTKFNMFAATTQNYFSKQIQKQVKQEQIKCSTIKSDFGGCKTYESIQKRKKISEKIIKMNGAQNQNQNQTQNNNAEDKTSIQNVISFKNSNQAMAIDQLQQKNQFQLKQSNFIQIQNQLEQTIFTKKQKEQFQVQKDSKDNNSTS